MRFAVVLLLTALALGQARNPFLARRGTQKFWFTFGVLVSDFKPKTLNPKTLNPKP